MTADGDAQEFAHAAGWRAGLLVARNVVISPGRIPPEKLAPKVKASTFARMSGTSVQRVLRHYRAWEHAADKNLVLPAAMLNPGEDVSLDDLPEWVMDPTRRHTVYIYLNANDTVLYVNASLDPIRRTSARSGLDTWWRDVATIRVEHFDDRPTAEDRETYLIRTLRPIYKRIA